MADLDSWSNHEKFQKDSGAWAEVVNIEVIEMVPLGGAWRLGGG